MTFAHIAGLPIEELAVAGPGLFASAGLNVVIARDELLPRARRSKAREGGADSRPG